MDHSEGDASLGDHFMQSLSRDLPTFSHQQSDLGLQMLPQSQENARVSYAAVYGSGLSSQPAVSSSMYQATSQGTTLFLNSSLSPGSVPQNLSKSATLQADERYQPAVCRAQQIALVPFGATDYIPVRLGQLAANLPLLAAKLTANSSNSKDPMRYVYPIVSEASIRRQTYKTDLHATEPLNEYSVEDLSADMSMGRAGKIGSSQAYSSAYISASIREHEVLSESDRKDESGYLFSLAGMQAKPLVAGPVYKSKLEKAIAQNQLSQMMQNSSRETREDPESVEATRMSALSERELHIDQPLNMMDEENENTEEPLQKEVHTMPISSINRNIQIRQAQKPLLQKKTVPVKAKDELSSLLGTKVAERYKNLVGDLRTSDQDPCILFYNPCPTQTERPIVTEKTYNDYDIGSSVLKVLSQLRAEEKFCDAILFLDEGYVKAHKIVLLAASPELQKKGQDYSNAELKLVLPDGITKASVETMINFIYHGFISLSVGNVQQIYRLSLIFGMDSVVRFCYDFCKEAKLGHLIIASPYQESVIHLDRITTTKQKLNKTLANKTAANGPSEKINNHLLEVQKVQVEENSFCEENNTSIKQSVSGTIKSTENNIVASREEFGIAEAASTENPQSQMQEIDWVTNDPSQSNIPIRKRGRNRKHVSGTLIRNTNSFDMADGKLDLAKETCHTGSGNDGNVNVQTPGTVSTGTTNVPASTCSSELLTEALKVVEVLECQNNLENVQHIVGVNKDNLSSKAAVNTDNEHQRKIENEEYTEMVDLPDPLASGILDDNELKKSDYLNEMFNEKKSATTTPAIKALKQTVTRPSTRFRKRLTHLSILEVASQKKAKSNDTSGKYVKVPSLRIKTKGMKVKEHQTVETDTVTSRQDDRLAAVEMATQEEHDIPLGTKDYSRHPNINKQLASPQKCLVVHKDVPVFFNNKKQQDTGNKEEIIRTQSKGNENQPGQMGNNVSSENHMDKQDDELSYASPPKKARLRKLTTEIINISDKVLMRQPPKKRSKEIREMMKIEDDKSSGKTKGGKTEACSKIAINLKTNKHSSTEMWHVANQGRHVETTANKTSILYNSHAVTEKVAQLELKGSKTTNIKLYRCCFCDREFLIAKRAITHVVNTHEIDLEDSVQYINIEDKNSPTKDSKMCDICGYKTKECGIYYIHYHKYFKHGVPLPKGWEPFRCDLCKKEFYTKFQLREHKLVHFEDNPFVCDTCGTKFKTRTALNSHVFHKHNKEKKFQCQECPKSFKTRTQIKVHMRVHSGEKPFLCPKPECQYRSTTRGNMKLHLSTKHKLQPNSVKQLMDALRPSVPGESNEIDVYIDNPDMYEQSLSTRSKDGATSSHLPSEILVFSDNRDHGMNNVYGGKNSSVMMSREENGDEYRTGFNRKAMGSSLRDYEALNDSLPMTMSQTNDENSSLNIDNSVDVSVPGQVQLFIQEVDKYIAEHSVPVSLTSNANVQKAKALDFYAKYGKSRSDMPKVIDPNSKEARIFLKEAFEHPEQTSLLKPALYQNTNHLANLIHVDHQSEQETRMSTKWNFNESDNLVIDLPDDVQASNSDIQKIHSQLENLRSSYQFRDNVSEVDLLHNINTSSQSQALDTGVLNVYHQRSASPPAYPNSSEMMVSMKAQNNDIVQPSDLTMDNVGQGEGQGHLRSNQQLLSGTLYSSINSRSTSSVQYGADGQLFEGYYQDQYDIENY